MLRINNFLGGIHFLRANPNPTPIKALSFSNCRNAVRKILVIEHISTWVQGLRRGGR